MKAKDLYRIISEEIQGFDFLNMDRVTQETEIGNLLSSKEFQVQLIQDICDGNRLEMDDIDVTYREEDRYDPDNTEFDFSIEFTYKYQETNVPIFITIEGDRKYIEDSAITFFSVDGQKVDFKWIEKNEGLKKKVIDCLVSDYTN